jgi:ParB-like chromosome segregation protein Spo0J
MSAGDYKKDLEFWPLNRFIEYDRNPRINDHAVDKVAAAIKEYGFKVPIVAKSDGLIVDGHLRLKAAKKLKLNEVPVLLADDLTDAQIKAFRISVNKMADIAEWDNDLLKLEFDDLAQMDFDLSLTGFDMGEIANLNFDGSDITPNDSSTKEIDVDDYNMSHICPKCGFEFDDK